MEQKTHSLKFLRQRKFFVVLPLLVLPFMTLMFWSLGGGQVSQTEAQSPLKGFNLQLPGANLKDHKTLDKLGYYEKAASDSLNLQKQIKNDPYYRMQPRTETGKGDFTETPISELTYSRPDKNKYTTSGQTHTDPNEEKVYRKLEELNEAMNRPTTAQSAGTVANEEIDGTPSLNSSEVQKLEQMMSSMNQSTGPDPEMEQLNQMLEKVLDIQYPDRVQERIRQNSELNRGLVFPVAVNNQRDPVSLMDYGGLNSSISDAGNVTGPGQNAFYSLNDAVDIYNNQNAIQSVIHETQTLVNGSTVKLRLVNDIYINGVLIPENSFVFGTAQLNGERLNIKINSIRYRNSLFPVALSVFDMDGMEGIYIPGAITRDVAKQSADRSMQGISITTLDPSIGAQAASAGIEAAKTLFSKKVKLIKVTVKAGYQVLLNDERQRHGS